MISCCSKGRVRAPLRGALVAVLTLCIFNIYPKMLKGEGTNVSSGNLSIDALFDFEVPVDVVSEGVSNGFGTLPDSWQDTMDGIMERNGWANGYEDLTEAEWGISTNGFISLGPSDGPKVFVDEGFFSGMDSNFLEMAISTNVEFPSESSPVASLPSVTNVDLLANVFSYFNSDSPPSSPLGLPSHPVVDDSDALFGDFWVQNLSMQSLINFDGGHLDSVIRELPRDGCFAWVLPAWVGTLDEVVSFVHDHPNGVRPYVRFVAVVLYWVALYRFLIKRIVFTIEACFQGIGAS